ncbi:class I SAM-dependent methyltransferase, partial [Shewanella sp. C32]
AEKQRKGRYIGVDINADVVLQARQAIEHRPQIEVHHTKMEEWAGPAEPVHMVMMNNILHYYSPNDRADLFHRTASFLKKNGTLTI